MTEPVTNHPPDEISLSELIRPIWKRRWVVLVITLVTGLAAFVISSLLPPTYTASATVLVVGRPGGAPGNPLHDIELGQRLVQSYVEIARSRTVAERAVSEAGLDVPVRQFQAATSVSVVPGTLLVRIGFSAATPLQAAEGANAVARALIAYLADPTIEELHLVNATIQEAAHLPEQRSAPRRGLNTQVGLFLGLFLGVGVALGHNYLDRRVKSAQDLEALGLLRLTEIPFQPEHEKGLVMEMAPSSPTGEAYRMLRTNLRFFDFKRQVKKLAIVSPDASQGKSSVAANLALVVAQNGQHAYLLDCDLRRSGLVKLFNLDHKPGLTDLLLGQASLESASHHLEGGRLAVVGCGTQSPNPAEMLGSSQMASLVREVSAKADLVIMDTPPALPFVDAFLVASLADAVLLVARRGQTNRDELAELKKHLETAGISVLGAILTDAELSKANRYHGYYYTAGMGPAKGRGRG